jgi:hypothetical protein
MRSFYYVVFSLRRFVGASSGSAFGEWKMRLLLLWIESTVVVSLWFVVSTDSTRSTNRYLLATAIVIPLLVLNEYLLAGREASTRYEKEFSALPRGKRLIAYTCAALIVGVSLTLPLVVRASLSDRPWWR